MEARKCSICKQFYELPPEDSTKQPIGLVIYEEPKRSNKATFHICYGCIRKGGCTFDFLYEILTIRNRLEKEREPIPKKVIVKQPVVIKEKPKPTTKPPAQVAWQESPVRRKQNT